MERETKTYTFRSEINPEELDKLVRNLGFKNRSELINYLIEQAINDINNIDEMDYNRELKLHQKKVDATNEKIKSLHEELRNMRQERRVYSGELKRFVEKTNKKKEKTEMTEIQKKELREYIETLVYMNLRGEYNTDTFKPLVLPRKKDFIKYFKTEKEFITEIKTYFEEITKIRDTAGGFKVADVYYNNRKYEQIDMNIIDVFKTRIENEIERKS